MPSRPQATTALALLRRQFQLAQIPTPPLPTPFRQIAEEILRLVESVGLRDFLDVSRFASLPSAIEARRLEEEARIRALYDRTTTLLLEQQALISQDILPVPGELERLARIEQLGEQVNAAFQQVVLLDEAVIEFIRARFGIQPEIEEILLELTLLRNRADNAEGEHLRAVFFVPFDFENAQATRKKREEAISAYLTFRQGLFRFLR